MSKKYQKILGALVFAFVVLNLAIAAPANAAVTIDNLGYSILPTSLECGVLKETSIKRDPSWSPLEYYVKVFEDLYIKKNTYEDVKNVDQLRAFFLQDVKDNWTLFVANFYTGLVIDFFHGENGVEPDYDYYTSQYREELDDEYYATMVIFNITAADPNIYVYDVLMSLYYGDTYDIVGNLCTNSTIQTTYDYQGYTTYLTMGGKPLAGYGLEDGGLAPISIDNGYVLHKDDVVDLKVTLSQIDTTTVRATYTLKNLSSEATDYGVGVYTDIQLGENDYAAIQKTSDSFTITQDNSEYENTFGAQFHISAAPTPTTTYIGEYYEAMSKVWENSIADHLTRADNIDTGLTFSWQGQINAGETKTFTATYSLNVAKSMENSFYYLLEDGVTHETSPSKTIPSIDGGALGLPETQFVGKKGYNRKWNTKSDGTGTNYDSEEIIIANKETSNYYEVDVANVVKSEIEKGDYGAEYNIVLTDDLANGDLKDLANETYNDVIVYIEIDQYDREDVEYSFEYTEFDPEEFLSEREGLTEHSFFYIYETAYYWTTSYNGTGWDSIPEKYLPVTVRVKFFPEDAAKIKNIVLLGITEEDGVTSEIPVTYNRETGEMFFEASDDIWYYRVLYEKVEEPLIPVPDTGKFTTFEKKSAESSIYGAVAISAILAAATLVIARRKTSKK